MGLLRSGSVLSESLLLLPKHSGLEGVGVSSTERTALDTIHEADCVNPRKSPWSLVQVFPPPPSGIPWRSLEHYKSFHPWTFSRGARDQ